MNHAVVNGSEIVRVVYSEPASLQAKIDALKPGEQMIECPPDISDETHEWDGQAFVLKE